MPGFAVPSPPMAGDGHTSGDSAPRRDASRTVAVIGGGASGALVAAQLLRRSHRNGLRVVVIEPRPRVGLGLAYSTTDETHRLNVPAGQMGALPRDAGHFVRWANGCGHEIEERRLRAAFPLRRVPGSRPRRRRALVAAADHPRAGPRHGRRRADPLLGRASRRGGRARVGVDGDRGPRRARARQPPARRPGCGRPRAGRERPLRARPLGSRPCRARAARREGAAARDRADDGRRRADTQQAGRRRGRSSRSRARDCCRRSTAATSRPRTAGSSCRRARSTSPS